MLSILKLLSKTVFPDRKRNVCRRLAELWRVCFDHFKVCRRLAEVRRVRFDHRKVHRKLAEHWRVRFDHRKVCRRLEIFEECLLTTAKGVGGLHKFVGSVLTT